MLTLVLGGCSFLTKPTPSIEVPVQQAKDLVSKAQVIHDRIYPILASQCQTNQMSASACLTLQAADTDFQQIMFSFAVALQNPGTSVDWANVQKLMDDLGKMAALLPKP